MESFRNLVPLFKRTRLVHLQGWGEPFLNPRFFDMVDQAKAAGCQVGTTTNATILDGARVGRLVESGVDLIAFSLAGTGPENDRIREGTSLRKVLDGIRALAAEKERRNASRPLIHVAYMLFRSGLDSLRGLPSLVKGLGVSDVVISTLDFASSEELLKEVLHPQSPSEYEEARKVIDSVVAEGEKEGMRFHYHLAYPERKRELCTENVTRALCVSSDGVVSPCVFTNLRMEEAFYRVGGEKKSYQRLSFGNVNEKPLADIWRCKEYKAFRASFRKGPLAGPCQGCPKLR
jgi:MoaA/NifB/PqqE/SkfB family radical SAM enzyme